MAERPATGTPDDTTRTDAMFGWVAAAVAFSASEAARAQLDPLEVELVIAVGRDADKTLRPTINNAIGECVAGAARPVLYTICARVGAPDGVLQAYTHGGRHSSRFFDRHLYNRWVPPLRRWVDDERLCRLDGAEAVEAMTVYDTLSRVDLVPFDQALLLCSRL